MSNIPVCLGFGKSIINAPTKRELPPAPLQCRPYKMKTHPFGFEFWTYRRVNEVATLDGLMIEVDDYHLHKFGHVVIPRVYEPPKDTGMAFMGALRAAWEERRSEALNCGRQARSEVPPT